MTTELDAIIGSDLVTMAFVYGSAAMMIAAMAVVTWLRRPASSVLALRTGLAA
jgi:hypothetical protein